MTFTAVIEKSDDGWFVGQIEEVPAAISQGKTKIELLENLKDALELLFKAGKDSVAKDYEHKDVLRERFEFSL